MKCHFWRLIFLPFKIPQHVYKCLNKYAYVHICIWIYMDIYIHILDLPSLLLCSQTSIKLDCCWVEDQLFSTEADQRLASIRSSLCWGLHWELFSVIFFSYVALASNDTDSDSRTGLFSLWSGTPAESHFCRAGARLRLQQWALCSGAVQATLQSWAQTGGLFKLIKRDALLLTPAQENTAVAKNTGGTSAHLHSQQGGGRFIARWDPFDAPLLVMEKAAPAISEGTWATAHLYLIWLTLIFTHWHF